MVDWNTPMLNSLKGTDSVALQQIIRNMIVEIQRLSSEIQSIKDSMNANYSTSIYKSR